MITFLIVAGWLMAKVAFVAIFALLAFRLRGGAELRTNAWQPLIQPNEFDANFGLHHGAMRAAA